MSWVVATALVLALAALLHSPFARGFALGGMLWTWRRRGRRGRRAGPGGG